MLHCPTIVSTVSGVCSGSTVTVHFSGWSTKYDEEVDISTAKGQRRVLPLNSRVPFWRDFSINDRLDFKV